MRSFRSACSKTRFLRATALSLAVALSFSSLTSTRAHATSKVSTSNSAFDVVKLPAGTPNPNNIQQFVLRNNGLRVVLCERHYTPVVSTMMVYRVGSRNEAVGYTGSTHFLEHLMFKGTRKHDPLQKTGIDNLLKPLGGYNNATTSFDRTNYFELVPAKNLSTTLEFEADRMRNLLLRPTDRASEMTVVRNELERGEDASEQLLQTNIFATAFREHPYHHPTIGWRTDVEGVPMERLRQFYNDFYWPNNATLIVIGDFKTANALAQIAKDFGGIKRSPKPIPTVYTTEPPQEGERRFLVQRGSDEPKMMVAFHTPKATNKDNYALDVLQYILGGETKPGTRLYKKLIDSGLASDVRAYNNSMRDPGLFTLYAAAAPKVPLEKVEAALLDEIKVVTETKMSDDEIARAKRSIIKSQILETADPLSLAELLGESLAVGDLSWQMNYAKNIQAVTASDVQAMAVKYFPSQNRTVGYYKPKADIHPKDEVLTSKTAETESAEGNDINSDYSADITTDHPAGKSKLEHPKGLGQFESKVETIILPNGLKVVVMPVSGSNTVAIAGAIGTGSYNREPNKSSVSTLLADVLTKGTKKYSKAEIANRLEDMGASLEFEDEDFFYSLATEVTKDDFEGMLDLIAQTIQQPLLSESALQISKKQLKSGLQDKKADTTEQAWNSFVRTVYKPDCVYYSKTFDDQIAELDTIHRSDLRSFHKQSVTPNNSVIAITGDTTPEKVRQLVEKYFSGWEGTGPAKEEISSKTLEPLKNNSKEIRVSLPDKLNADVFIGKPIAVSVHSKDYYATKVANAALGYDSFVCRLAPVRDKFGLTYSISSSISQETYPFSPWAIAYSVNPVNFDRTAKLVHDIVGDFVKHGITTTELNEERSQLAGAYYVGMRSPKQIAHTLCRIESLGLDASFLDNFSKNVGAVTKEQVNQAIRRYFDLRDAVTAASGTFEGDKGATKPNVNKE